MTNFRAQEMSRLPQRTQMLDITVSTCTTPYTVYFDLCRDRGRLPLEVGGTL